MELRDQIEQALRSWDAYETARWATPVIDFDCFPDDEDIEPASDRLAVYRRLNELRREASESGAKVLAARLTADCAYLSALLGERMPLGEYVLATQGCHARGWPAEYIRERGELARKSWEALGIAWGPQLIADVDELCEPIKAADAPDAIRQAATEYEPAVRQATGTDAPYELAIEAVSIDDYWAYWLDGTGQRVRLRLNLRNASFTRVASRQFALHEVLGHGLQNASFAARCAREQVPWVRLMSVHARTQVLLEGLAEAMPLFITPDDEALTARVRLAHYSHLIRASLHLSINSSVSVGECVRYAKSSCPWWTDAQIADLLADRGANPRLRSYLWSYPAGLDWFAALADADTTVIERVLRTAYREPLAPDDLSNLWPDGPPIGGPGTTGSAVDSPAGQDAI